MLIFIQSATALPGWLNCAAQELSQNNGEWIVRVMLGFCALTIGLIALGPERIKVMRSAFSPSLPPVATTSPQSSTCAECAERLREALSEGMRLRTRLVMESQAHWEGEKLVQAKPAPAPDDPLYQWARKTYDLLTVCSPAHADVFYGESPVLGGDYFELVFTTEVKQPPGRQGYLERRIALLKEVAAKPR